MFGLIKALLICNFNCHTWTVWLLHEENYTFVAKLQCKVDWPWLQLIVNCGDAVTVRGDWVICRNFDALLKFQVASSVVSGMIWCAMCSYHSSFNKDFIRGRKLPCDLPMSNQLTAWSIDVGSVSQLMCARDCGWVTAALAELCYE